MYLRNEKRVSALVGVLVLIGDGAGEHVITGTVFQRPVRKGEEPVAGGVSDADYRYPVAIGGALVVLVNPFLVVICLLTVSYTHLFRVWANKVLKEYLIKGYAVNQQVKIEQLEDLKNTVHLLSNVIEHKQLTLDEANGLLRVITDYTYGLDTLDKYDFQQLEVVSTTPSREFRATYEEAMGAIHLLQEKFGSSDLFGNEKDQSFKSSINTHCFSCSGAASLTLIEAIFFLSFPYFTLSSTSGLP